MPGTLIEHREQTSKINHRGCVWSSAILQMAIIACKFVAYILGGILRRLIKNELALMDQGRLL
jgi:hypothetical protein